MQGVSARCAAVAADVARPAGNLSESLKVSNEALASARRRTDAQMQVRVGCARRSTSRRRADLCRRLGYAHAAGDGARSALLRAALV